VLDSTAKIPTGLLGKAYHYLKNFQLLLTNLIYIIVNLKEATLIGLGVTNNVIIYIIIQLYQPLKADIVELKLAYR
jgi:hypothetical protein